MEIKRYTALLLHWWWLIILGVLIAAGTAFLVSYNTTPIYSSSTRLLVDQAPGDDSYADFLRTERLSATYVELVTVEPTLAEVAVRLELPFGAETLAGMVSARAQPDTQILSVQAQDLDPLRAANIANTVGQVFIENLQEQQGARFQTAIQRFDEERQRVGDEIERLETEINRLSTLETLSAEQEAQLSRLETNLTEQQNTYNRIFNDSQALRIDAATQTNNVVIIESAEANPNPIRPQTTTNTALAAVVGGMMALGVIFLVDYLDDSIKVPDQVEMMGVSPIGHVPYIKNNPTNPAERLVTNIAPRSPVSEAYRVLRTNLAFSSIDEELRSLVVTSSSPSEGKSTTAANLATVMAQAGNRVILMDGDLRRPVQNKIFELPNNRGLTTALLDSDIPLDEHIQDTNIAGLRVLTSGPQPPNPAELLNSQRMTQVIEDLKLIADIVVIDAPPTLTVADASIIAPKTNGALLVIKVGETKQEAFVHALRSLQKTNGHIFGAVMNRVNPNSGSQYGYYYRYYTYEYGEEFEQQAGRRWLPKWLTG